MSTAIGDEQSRLRWRCRRGMLELDLLLQGFVEQGYTALDETERVLFMELLEMPDQELFEYLMAIKKPEKKEFSPVIEKIRHTTTAQA